MRKKRRTHKQSKYLTIMLVPDATSSSVKSVKIAHWVFYVFASVLLCIALVITALMISNQIANDQIINVSKELKNSQIEKQELEQEVEVLESTKSEIEQEKSKIETSYEMQQGEFDQRIEQFKNAIREAEQRIEELEDAKQELYDRMSSSSLSPVQKKATYRPSVQMAPTIAVGGGSNVDELEAMIVSLNTKIDYEAEDYGVLNQDVSSYASFKASFPNAWPVTGRITSEEGYRSNPFGGSGTEYHDGMDISVPMGTSVRAAGGGKVIKSEYNSGGYGYLVVIDHGYGIHSFYAHNSELLVNVGQYVSRGDVIAKSGSTGRSTGPHVHFQIEVNGVVKNPRSFLEEAL